MPDVVGQAKVRVDSRRLDRRTTTERRPRGTRLEIDDNRLDSRVRRQHSGRETRERDDQVPRVEQETFLVCENTRVSAWSSASMKGRTAACPSGNVAPGINPGGTWIVDIEWTVLRRGIDLHDIAENHKWWEGVGEFCRECVSAVQTPARKIIRKMQTAATREEILENWGTAEPMMNASDQYTITETEKRYFPALAVKGGAWNSSTRMF